MVLPNRGTSALSLTRTRPRSAAAVVLAVAALGLTACASSGSPGDSPTPTSSPTPSATQSASPSGSPCPSTTSLGAVYYVADVKGQGPRLYREFTQVAGCPGGAIGGAVQTMFSVPPKDPDYTSVWPTTTTVLSVTTSGSVATVDVSQFVAVGAAFETAAVQQLVWTATAADKSVTKIQLLVNGQTPPSGHSDWSQPVGRASSLDTLANVWILQPTEGASVASPVTIRVYGTGFEGNVPLKIFDDGGLVATTTVTTQMGGFAEASTRVRLAKGTYVVKAYNDNGQDASLQLWDSKTFTVG